MHKRSFVHQRVGLTEIFVASSERKIGEENRDNEFDDDDDDDDMGSDDDLDLGDDEEADCTPTSS